jgi:putative transposase
LHGLLDWEREAILALHAQWGEFDRSHRKLAHRGSYLERVWVSESTVRKVLAAEGLVLQGNPPREPIPRKPWPDWLEWKPNRIWGYDFTHFTRADQAWIETLFGHVKGEWPHLEKITDPGELQAELELFRTEYNAVRLHAGIGCVTPNDEHEGRGEVIRTKRADGLAQARDNRITYRRCTTNGNNP